MLLQHSLGKLQMEATLEPNVATGKGRIMKGVLFEGAGAM